MISSHHGRADRIVMTVTNTDPRLMKWLKDNVGGRVNWTIHRNRPNRRPCFVWTCNETLTIQILKEILPYLVVKREQAEIVLAFSDLPDYYPSKGIGRSSKRIGNKDISIRNDMMLKLKTLKRICPPAEIKRGDIFIQEDDAMIRTTVKAVEEGRNDPLGQLMFQYN